jgi:hypothetical protein
LYGLPEYAKRTIRRIETMKVDPAKVAEREAREHAAAFPGPLETADDPPGCSARMKAARAATRTLMQMRKAGETPELAAAFDRACERIEPGLGFEVRDVVFGPEPNDSEPIGGTIFELKGNSIELSMPTIG